MNTESINLHQDVENDEALRASSEREMEKRRFDLEADQLAALALNMESLNEINESKRILTEAKKRKAMSYLIECSFKNSNIVNSQLNQNVIRR